MSVTAVSGQFVATSGTSATAIAGTLLSAPTPGNLLVASVCCAGLVTPTATGAWNKLTQIQSVDTGCLFWKIVPASDPALQTLTSAGTGSSWGVVIAEFTGATASPLLTQNNQASTTVSKVSPSVSPTASVEALVVGGAFSDGARTFSASAFTGTNVGSVTNAGTGSRGTAAAGESCTLWYAAISSTTGSYTATVTCSAADGGGAAVAVFLAAPARSLTGAQPSGSGSLSAVHGMARSLSGAQPVLVAVAYADPAVTYADVDVYYTGRSPGTVTAEEAVGGHFDRTAAGSQPTATGALNRLWAARRTGAGAQPTALGTLARLKAALKSLTGAQPTALGTLTRRLQSPRTLSGAAPTALGTLAQRIAATRLLTGLQTTATGTLTRRLAAPRSLLAAQPTALGTLARRIAVSRPLTGTQPSGTGASSNDASLSRELVGSQPTALGTLARRSAVHLSLTALQPAASGTLGRLTHHLRALAGAAPSAVGALVRRLTARRAVAGAGPAPTGSLTVPSAGLAYTRSVGGVQPMALPAPTYADPNVPYADTATTYAAGRSPGRLTRSKGYARALTGAAPGGSSTLSTGVARVLEYAFFSSAGGVELGLVYQSNGSSSSVSFDQDLKSYAVAADVTREYTTGYTESPSILLPVTYADPTVTYADPTVTYVGRTPNPPAASTRRRVHSPRDRVVVSALSSED